MPQDQHLSGTFGHNGGVTPPSTALADLRVDVKSIDPALLGRRIRHARQRAGLTQGDAAGTDMSTAYISRIEAGQRRPGADLLIALAERLHCTPEELLAPDDSVVTYDAEVVARLTLELDYGDLSLRTGSPNDALGHADVVLAEAERTSAVPPALRRQAALMRAAALESLGRPDEALLAYEAVVEDDDEPLRLISALTALSRLYRESGDLGRAVDIGDRALALVEPHALDASAEGIKLTVTVAAAHFQRGDVNHALRLCQATMASADRLDSPQARAAVYWNTSVMESRNGRVEAALPLAEKALALLEAAEDARNQTRLRIQLGLLHLRSDPPLPQEALTALRQATRDAETTDLAAADRARIAVGLARAHLMLDELDEAALAVRDAHRESASSSPFLAVQAQVLDGQIALATGRRDAALETFRAAAVQLETVQDSAQEIAQLWFDLGAILDSEGQYREASQAFKAASALSGTGMTAAAAAGR